MFVLNFMAVALKRRKYVKVKFCKTQCSILEEQMWVYFKSDECSLKRVDQSVKVKGSKCYYAILKVKCKYILNFIDVAWTNKKVRSASTTATVLFCHQKYRYIKFLMVAWWLWKRSMQMYVNFCQQVPPFNSGGENVCFKVMR